MSYQVLARKWRPRSFSTLVGQEHVVRALSHALETGRLHHAWLFTGTRGVGKTTISRILAKALNCDTGITAEPCGRCPACLAIDADRFPDYIEMDAASNRGVDDMAALLDQAMYTPVQGRFKVYMIDEVHMLTGHAFNAMLKTLEEPPEHVKFILATTDPQKIPVTVLSRCLQFNLKQMPPGHIVGHLSRVLQSEEVVFEEAALKHIAKAAAGSMRDALSLLDQSIAHGAGRVETEQVINMLGTVGDDHLFDVLDALAAGEVADMLAVADTMQARSLSFEAALQGLASLVHRLALMQFAPTAIADPAERDRLTPYVETFDAEFLQLAYQIAIHGRDELSLAPDEYAGFTMVLLRLHAFRPVSPSSAGSLGGAGGQPASAPRRSAPASSGATKAHQSPQALPLSPQLAPVASASTPPAVVATPEPAQKGTPIRESRITPGTPADDSPSTTPPGSPSVHHTGSAPAIETKTQPTGDVPPWESLPDEAMHADRSISDSAMPPFESELEPAAPAKAAKMVQATPQSHPANPSLISETSGSSSSKAPKRDRAERSPLVLPDAQSDNAKRPHAAASSDGLAAVLAAGDWHGACQMLELGGMLRELAQHCEWVGWDDKQVELRLSQTHHHLLDLNTNLLDRLSEQLAVRLGSPARVRITIGSIQGETPAQRDEAVRLARHAHAVEALESDAMVRLLIERFDATLIEASVKPL